MPVVLTPESLLFSVIRWPGINASYWLAVSSTLEPIPRRRASSVPGGLEQEA